MKLTTKASSSRIAGLHQGDGRFVHAGAFLAHAAAVIDHQTHGDGNVFALEHGKLLLGFILKYAEVFFLQAFSEASAIIEHGGMQYHQVDADLDRPLVAGVLARRKRLRSSWERRLRGLRKPEHGGNQQQASQQADGRQRQIRRGKVFTGRPGKISGSERSTQFWRKP